MSLRYTATLNEAMKVLFQKHLHAAVNSWLKNFFLNSNNFQLKFQFTESLFCSIEKQESELTIFSNDFLCITSNDLSFKERIQYSAFNIDNELLNLIDKYCQVKPSHFIFSGLYEELINHFGFDVKSHNIPSQKTFKINVEADYGIFNIYMDWFFIKSIISEEKVKSNNLCPLNKASKNNNVPLKVSLKTVPINFAKAMSLRKGDIIMLNQNITSSIPIEVNGVQNLTKGYLVKSKNKKAIIFSET